MVLENFVYIVLKKQTIIGVFDDLKIFFGKDFSEEIDKKKEFKYRNYTICAKRLNHKYVTENKIILKGKNFTLENLDSKLELLDVENTNYL